MFKMIKIFECNLCKKYKGTRKGLRNHLREEHSKRKELTNFTNMKERKVNQSWWKWKEFI